MLIWPIWPNVEVEGLDWQCCLAGSSKTAPRIFIYIFILCEIHYYFCPHIFRVYYFSLSHCARHLAKVGQIVMQVHFVSYFIQQGQNL